MITIKKALAPAAALVPASAQPSMKEKLKVEEVEAEKPQEENKSKEKNMAIKAAPKPGTLDWGKAKIKTKEETAKPKEPSKVSAVPLFSKDLFVSVDSYQRLLAMNV